MPVEWGAGVGAMCVEATEPDAEELHGVAIKPFASIIIPTASAVGVVCAMGEDVVDLTHCA